jgi:hypothetical protein
LSHQFWDYAKQLGLVLFVARVWVPEYLQEVWLLLLACLVQ